MKTDNELIAEFDGYKFVDDDREAFPLGYYIPPSRESGGEIKCIEDFEYHTSWDWLMPVVEKINEPEVKEGKIIRSSADVQIMYKACHIEYNADEDFEDREDWEIHTQGETKIEAVYKAVVEFIKWFNS